MTIRNNFKKLLAIAGFALLAMPGPLALAGSPATVVTTSDIGETAKVGEIKNITWESANFPPGAFVNINLIKQASDSPKSFELVRKIAEYSVNDGVEDWKIAKSDVGEKLFIEVTCAGSIRFEDGCRTTLDMNKTFAVETSFANNLANALASFLEAIGF